MLLCRLVESFAYPGLELSIDLAAARISSAGFIALAGARVRLRAVGGSMVVANVPPRFRGDLQLVGLVPTPAPSASANEPVH